ncbi:hypothetical protein, partial [Escherichia coli]|uniref:hypothetical protein n=2 Tax=Escherichia coli TaxID=562 RepID=UPI000B426F83
WSTSKTPSYTKSVSWQHHHYNLVIRFGIIFIIKTEFCISFSSRKTTKKSITILVHFFKQFLKTDSGYGAMGIFFTQCF